MVNALLAAKQRRILPTGIFAFVNEGDSLNIFMRRNALSIVRPTFLLILKLRMLFSRRHIDVRFLAYRQKRKLY